MHYELDLYSSITPKKGTPGVTLAVGRWKALGTYSPFQSKNLRDRALQFSQGKGWHLKTFPFPTPLTVKAWI